MDIQDRPQVVRASLRMPRFVFATAMAVMTAIVGAFACVLLASPFAGPLLTHVDRIGVEPANEIELVVINRTTTERERPDRAPTIQHHDENVRIEILKDEDIRWLSDDVRYFNGRPIRPVRQMTMIVTAYSPDERSCGKWADGITASGYSVWTNGMKLVAADTRILPFGSLISIPGYDNENVVPVLDRGGAIKGKRLDVLYPTHERAMRWGVQELEITVWDYADGAPNDFRQNHRRRR